MNVDSYFFPQGVVYAGIDTDKHRYPIGSGRVTFGNLHSYKKAVAAAFVEIKCQKFCKKVQVSRLLDHKYVGRTFHKRWILIWRMRSARHASSDKDLTFAGLHSFSGLSIMIQRACVLPLLLPDLLGITTSESLQSQTFDEVILSISKYFINYTHTG